MVRTVQPYQSSSGNPSSPLGKVLSRKLNRWRERYRPIEQIAKALKKARRRTGWTQAELAEKMNTHQGVISRVESARKFPSIAFLQRAADLFQSSFEIKILPTKHLQAAKLRKAPLAQFKPYRYRTIK